MKCLAASSAYRPQKRPTNYAKIAVSKKAQGKGVGKALCLQALNICKEYGAKNAAIETQSNNIAALRAYMASGFKITQSFFTFAWRER
jgi:ribosomal protein S18 acetylase RimI-like enzyme